MKRLMIIALLGGQLMMAAPPALAAGFGQYSAQQAGAFGGLRLRVPLDGDIRHRRLRAGLTVAPTLHSQTMQGESRLRIGEGLELSLAGDRPVSLTLAGARLDRLGAAQDEDEDGGGIPAWALIAGGFVVTLGAAYLVFAEVMNDASE